MKSYVELKKLLSEELTEQKRLQEENILIYEKLLNFTSYYPEPFRILQKDVKDVNFSKLSIRLEVLKEEIELSNIKEEDKIRLYEVIELVNNRVKENLAKEKTLTKETNKEIKERKKYLQEKRVVIEANIRKVEMLDRKIKAHKQLINKNNIEDSIKENAKNIIDIFEKEKQEVKDQTVEIFESDKTLREDFILLFKEEKERKEKNKENKKEEVIVANNEIKENIETQEEIEPTMTPSIWSFASVADKYEEKKMPIFNVKDLNLEEQKSEEKEETTLTKEEIVEEIAKNIEMQEVETINPLQEEQPKKVKSKHKASKDLVNKITKAGKIGLGVFVIGAALAAIVMNPIALAAIPAGGLIAEQAKEYIKKK